MTRAIFLKALSLLPTRETFDATNGDQMPRLLTLGLALTWHIDTLSASLPP